MQIMPNPTSTTRGFHVEARWNPRGVFVGEKP